MSKRAVEWAKAFEAGRGLWMPRSHWRALRVVAQFYHEGLGCAFASLHELADNAGMSERHLRRTITELDEMGVVRRNLVQRSRDKSDASNEYELPAYRLVEADAAIRGRIFTIARERITEQARLELPVREDVNLTHWMEFLECLRTANAAHAAKALSGVEGECPAGKYHDVEGGCPVVVLAAQPRPAPCNGVDRVCECPGEGDALSGEPRTPCPPVDLTKDYDDEVEPPYAPPYLGGIVETREEQPQRQRLPDRSGGSSNVVVFPKRQRSPREPREAVRSMQWDGEEAALWEEMKRVLEGCGVVFEQSGRKLREAVTLALQKEWRDGDESLAAVADRAIEMWTLYVSLGLKLRVRCGLRSFFASGEWLHSGRWRYDKQEIEFHRRRGL